jgi:hypothetical protein
MTNPQFPGNSKSTPPASEPRKVEKVVTSEVRSRPKPLGTRLKQAIIGGDSKSVVQWVIVEVLIPQVKDMIADAATQGIQRLIFADDRPTRRLGSRGPSPTNYSRYSTRPISTSGREDRKTATPRTHEIDDLIFETRTDAQAVLEQMYEDLAEYKMVSVADVMAMVQKSSTFTDQKWGWEDLQGSDIRMVRDGYLLHLPRTVFLE